MKIEKLENDFEIILSLIGQHSGKITWYSLARKTKLNIKGVLSKLSQKGYITSSKVVNLDREKEYFSITEYGESYLENSKNYRR